LVADRPIGGQKKKPCTFNGVGRRKKWEIGNDKKKRIGIGATKVWLEVGGTSASPNLHPAKQANLAQGGRGL